MKSQSSNKSFGLLFFVVFLIIGLWPLKNGESLNFYFIITSVVFLILGLDFSKVNLETFEAYEYKLYGIENEFMNKCENFLKSDNPIVADIFIAKKFSDWFNQNTDLI